MEASHENIENKLYVLRQYVSKVKEHHEMESRLTSLKEKIKEANLLYEKTEEDLRSLHSVGQIVGDVLKPLEDNEKFIVKASSGPRYVTGRKLSLDPKSLTPGSRVALDMTTLTIMHKLPREVDPTVYNMLKEDPGNVKYKDVGGLTQQLRETRETIELPLTHPDFFQRVGVKTPKGVLLYGPPGTGKTLLAKALASNMSCNFLKVVASAIVDKYIGESARVIREMFSYAKDHQPCIIFIDEIDAIGGNRFNQGTSADREIQRTLMELLNQLDGFDDLGAVKVIMATNRPDVLDPALLRPGRLDRKIEIPLPNEAAREEILKIHTASMSKKGEIDYEAICVIADGFNGADLRNICTEAGMFAIRAERDYVIQEDFIKATLNLPNGAGVTKASPAFKNPHNAIGIDHTPENVFGWNPYDEKEQSDIQEMIHQDLPQWARNNYDIMQLTDLYQQQLADLVVTHSQLVDDQQAFSKAISPLLNEDGAFIKPPDENLIFLKRGLDLRLLEFEEDCRRMQKTERHLQRKIDDCTLTYETSLIEARGYAEGRLIEQIQEQQKIIQYQQYELDELRFQRDLYSDETLRLRQLCRFGNYQEGATSGTHFNQTERLPIPSPRTLHKKYSGGQPPDIIDADSVGCSTYGTVDDRKGSFSRPGTKHEIQKATDVEAQEKPFVEAKSGLTEPVKKEIPVLEKRKDNNPLPESFVNKVKNTIRLEPKQPVKPTKQSTYDPLDVSDTRSMKEQNEKTHHTSNYLTTDISAGYNEAVNNNHDQTTTQTLSPATTDNFFNISSSHPLTGPKRIGSGSSSRSASLSLFGPSKTLAPLGSRRIAPPQNHTMAKLPSQASGISSDVVTNFL